jgi:uncharacterized protein (TIGR02996 family)
MSAIPELEAHLREHPEDWESWLVYADWLTDQDDMHGQLIRLEHRLGVSPEMPRREREELERSVRKLIRTNRWQGVWPLKRRRGYLCWQHGFPWSAELHGGSAARALQLLLEQVPTQFLGSLSFHGLLAKDVSPLAQALGRTHAHSLAFYWPHLEEDALVRLWGAVRLRHLQLFNLAFELDQMDGRLGETLAGLRSLTVDGSATDAGLAALARSGGFSSLTGLLMSQGGLGPSSAGLIASSPVFSRLSLLDLSTNELGDEGAAALARGGSLRGLTELHLSETELGPEGLGEMIRSGMLRNVRTLALDGNSLGDEGARLLAESEDLQALQALSLHSCELTCRGAEALARSPHLGGLLELVLSFNTIEDRGVLALASSPTLRGLTSLQLLGNEVSQGAREKFAALRPELTMEWLSPSEYEEDEEWDDEWDEFEEEEE